MAVGRVFCDRIGRQIAAGTSSIVDNDGLSQGIVRRYWNRAGNRIGSATRWGADQQLNWSRRIAFRLGALYGHQGACKDGTENHQASHGEKRHPNFPDLQALPGHQFSGEDRVQLHRRVPLLLPEGRAEDSYRLPSASISGVPINSLRLVKSSMRERNGSEVPRAASAAQKLVRTA